MDTISGIVILDKEGLHGSRLEASRLAHKLGVKKFGHIGTLDPFASGLLIVLLGRATKLSPFLESCQKTYIAKLKLGIKTDSGDLDGNVVESSAVPVLTRKQIEDALNSFLGESTQIPPMFSALKKDGKPLYQYAREGIEIEREPRKINIDEIKLLDYSDDIITFSAQVSKGTYIRTLGEDIARKLGTFGHLISLRRTAVGHFKIEDSVTCDKATIDDVIPAKTALSFMPSYILKSNQVFKAINGAKLAIESDEEKLLIFNEGEPIAVYQRESDGVYSCLRGIK